MRRSVGRTRSTYQESTSGSDSEPKSLCGRGAIDHDRVVVPGAGVLLHLEQGEQLVHPGKDEELLGLDPGHAAPIEHRHQLAPDGPPLPFQLLLGIDLLAEQTGHHLPRSVTERDVEGVGQAVGGVGRGDQGAVAVVGGGDGGGGGDRRLSLRLSR